jgi:hypothetical protein
MRIVRPTDPGYDKDCEISNARFDYRPWAIYYCESAQDVVTAIGEARALRKAVRIRSGGHQHEGMCTANGVLLIDVSSMNSIDHREPGRVWIGAGAPLTMVYVAMWQHGYLFSGGGCGDVHLGGLTQGGGWGPVARKLGLTCDSLVAVEIVTAFGQIKKISQDGSASDRALMVALRGGGGGNFGVITKFCFRMHPWGEGYTDVLLSWGDEQLPGARLDQFVLNWVGSFPRDADDNLTTFLRVSVVDEPGGARAVIGGRYLGDEAVARQVTRRLLGNQPLPRTAEYTKSPRQFVRSPADTEPVPIDPDQLEALGKTLGTLPGYQPGPALVTTGAVETDAQANLSETCAGIPIRHKISSGFARPQFDLPAVQTLTSFIRNSQSRPEAHQYVSFHCLGGAIATDGEGSSFAFRDRNFLLQYQAWWQREAGHLDGPCIEWIKNFRLAMAPHTDGAFINFVDRDIPLPEYYKGKLAHLINMKQQWDPDKFFRFEMSIP